MYVDRRVQIAIRFKPTFAFEHALAQRQGFFPYPTRRADLTRRFKAVDSHELLAVLVKHPLELEQEVWKTQIADMSPPQAFHRSEIEGLEAKRIA